MAIPHSQKVAILEELNNQVVPQKSVVILTTQGATQSLDSVSNFKIRSTARQNGVAIKVVKNTLIKKAFESTPNLVGPSYLAYMIEGQTSDEVTVPKIIVDLISKDFKDNIGIVGAVVNGEFLDAKQTEQLSKTPSFNDSMAMLAGSLNQLATKIALGVKEIPAGVARGISAYSKTL
jgi:large subunit ribosomal protein L10